MTDNKAMEEFASNLWENYMKEKAQELLQNNLSAFRAVVTANPGGGTLTVQRPFDFDKEGNQVSMTLKCAGSMEEATSGTEVLCIVIGTVSNSFVLCNADLSNL